MRGDFADQLCDPGRFEKRCCGAAFEVPDALALGPVIRRECASEVLVEILPGRWYGGDALPLDAEYVRERGGLPRCAKLVAKAGIEARDQSAAPFHEPADRLDLSIVQAGRVRQDQHLVGLQIVVSEVPVVDEREGKVFFK